MSEWRRRAAGLSTTPLEVLRGWRKTRGRAALTVAEQPSCMHQEGEREELRWSDDRQRALGDELPASPRCDMALHDRANSFQAASEGEGERERRRQ